MFETECKESLGIINCTYIGSYRGISYALSSHPSSSHQKDLPKQNSATNKTPAPSSLTKKTPNQPCNTAKQ